MTEINKSKTTSAIAEIARDADDEAAIQGHSRSFVVAVSYTHLTLPTILRV